MYLRHGGDCNCSYIPQGGQIQHDECKVPYTSLSGIRNEHEAERLRSWALRLKRQQYSLLKRSKLAVKAFHGMIMTH